MDVNVDTTRRLPDIHRDGDQSWLEIPVHWAPISLHEAVFGWKSPPRLPLTPIDPQTRRAVTQLRPPSQSQSTSSSSSHSYTLWDRAVLESMISAQRSQSSSSAAGHQQHHEADPQHIFSLYPDLNLHLTFAEPLKQLLSTLDTTAATSPSSTSIRATASLHHSTLCGILEEPYEGDEAAGGQPLVRRLTDAANDIMRRIASAGVSVGVAPVVGRWNGIGRGENVRPDLVAPDSVLDVKTSINSLYLASGGMGYPLHARLSPDIAPRGALRLADVVVSDRDGFNRLDQGPTSYLIQIVVQMRTHAKTHGILIDYDMAWLVKQTGPFSYSYALTHMRSAEDHPGGPPSLFGLLCSVLLRESGTAPAAEWSANMTQVRNRVVELNGRVQSATSAQSPLAMTSSAAAAAAAASALDHPDAGDAPRHIATAALTDERSPDAAADEGPMTPEAVTDTETDNGQMAQAAEIPWSTPESKGPASLDNKAKAVTCDPDNITAIVDDDCRNEAYDLSFLHAMGRHLSPAVEWILLPSAALTAPSAKIMYGSMTDLTALFIPVHRIEQFDLYKYEDPKWAGDPNSLTPPTPPVSPGQLHIIELDSLEGGGRYTLAYRGRMLSSGRTVAPSPIPIVAKFARPADADLDSCQGHGEDGGDDDEGSDAVRKLDGVRVGSAAVVNEFIREIETYLTLAATQQTSPSPSPYYPFPRMLGAFVARDRGQLGSAVDLVVLVTEYAGVEASRHQCEEHRSAIERAFDYLWSRGMVHGDPARRHIRLEVSGEGQQDPNVVVKLIDFGRTSRASEDEIERERWQVALLCGETELSDITM